MYLNMCFLTSKCGFHGVHELTHQSNYVIQIKPFDGHVYQTPYYEFGHNNVLHKPLPSTLNFTFYSNRIEIGLQPIIPYLNNLFKAYCFYNNHIPFKDLITLLPRK
jgi:hypothetical protein